MTRPRYASAMNHDLDAFDDWFGSLDKKHAGDDFDDSPKHNHHREKAIAGKRDEVVRINAGDDDFSDSDSSDDDSKKKRPQKSPQRGLMSRRQSGALEDIFSIQQKAPTKSESRATTRNRAIELLRDADKARAQKALAAREDSKRKNAERRQSISNSLAKHLGAGSEDITNRTRSRSVSSRQKSITRRSRSQYSSSHKQEHYARDVKESSARASAATLTALYGKITEATGSTQYSNGTEATSDESISSRSDDDQKTELRPDESAPLSFSNVQVRRKKDPLSRSSHGPKKDPLSRSSHGPQKDPISRSSHGPQKDLLSRSSHGPQKDPLSRSSHGPQKDPLSRSSHGPQKDPLSRSSHGPQKDPLSRSSHGPQKDPLSRSSHGPKKDPLSRSSHGPQKDPLSRSSHGPQKDPLSRSSHGPRKDPLSRSSHGPRNSSHGPTPCRSKVEGSSTRPKDILSLSPHGPPQNRPEGSAMRKKMGSRRPPRIPSDVHASSILIDDLAMASVDGPARSRSVTEGSSLRKDALSNSPHDPKRSRVSSNEFDPFDPIGDPFFVEDWDTDAPSPRSSTSDRPATRIKIKGDSNSNWRDPFSQSSAIPNPTITKGASGTQARRQMYVRSPSRRSIQQQPEHRDPAPTKQTGHHPSHSTETGRRPSDERSATDEPRRGRRRDYARSSSSGNLMSQKSRTLK